MNFASKSRNQGFYSPLKQKLATFTFLIPPLQIESATASKPLNLDSLLKKKWKKFRSLSCETLDLEIYKDSSNFELKLAEKKSESDAELEILLHDITDYCQEISSEAQTVFFASFLFARFYFKAFFAFFVFFAFFLSSFFFVFFVFFAYFLSSFFSCFFPFFSVFFSRIFRFFCVFFLPERTNFSFAKSAVFLRFSSVFTSSSSS